MELDAFTSRLGLGQGRVQPATVPPGGGDWAFVLGEDRAHKASQTDEVEAQSATENCRAPPGCHVLLPV